MDKNKIKKEYNKKIQNLVKLNKYYYELSKPLVNDYEYDQIKADILSLEKKYDFLESANSPSKIVGFKPSKTFKKVLHRVPMLSLSNAFDEEDLVNFEKKINNFLDQKSSNELEYSAEPKIDGISASLIFKKGKFIMGLSRGDGKEGEDITNNLMTIDDIPKNISAKNFPDEIDIRGEVFIQNNDFENLKDKFANPRNAASGSLRQKNPQDTKKIPLKFIAYTFGYVNNMEIKNQSNYLKQLSEWGFKTNPFNKTIKGIKNLMKNYHEIEKKRNEIDFDIDGIVYKINSFDLQKRLGNVANSPRWAIAHKFSANKGISKILNIEIQVGRTGALTPVAKINPINIGGVIVSSATLHNEDYIAAIGNDGLPIRDGIDIRVNDWVEVYRAGDVIPKIKGVVLEKRSSTTKKFKYPVVCPSCGSPAKREENDSISRCTGAIFCPAQAIEGLKHFVSRRAMNIDGFGNKIIEDFFLIDWIKTPVDIFRLEKSFGPDSHIRLEDMDGWGLLSAANLFRAINEARFTTLSRFIYALGIRHIGEQVASLLAKNYLTWENFYSQICAAHSKKSDQWVDLCSIDGIGKTMAESLVAYFYSEQTKNMMSELISELHVEDFEIVESKRSVLKNLTVVFTGTLQQMTRLEAKARAEEQGAKVTSSLSSKTDLLVLGENSGSKARKAKELQVKIISEYEWLDLLSKAD